MRVTYIEDVDILEIQLKEGDGSLASEEADNIGVFRNVDTDEITGYAILDFKYMLNTGELEKFPWIFDYKKDLLPRLKRKGLI